MRKELEKLTTEEIETISQKGIGKKGIPLEPSNGGIYPFLENLLCGSSFALALTNFLYTHNLLSEPPTEHPLRDYCILLSGFFGVKAYKKFFK